MSDTHNPRARARLNVEAFVAAMIEREPLPVVARVCESIARETSARLRSTVEVTVWHHPGAASIVADIAARLLDTTADAEDRESLYASGIVLGAGAAGVAPPRPSRDEILAVNEKLAAMARGAGASASLTSADLALLAHVLGEAAVDDARSSWPPLVQHLKARKRAALERRPPHEFCGPAIARELDQVLAFVVELMPFGCALPKAGPP